MEDEKPCLGHCSCVDEEVCLKCNDYSAAIRRLTKEQFRKIQKMSPQTKSKRNEGEAGWIWILKSQAAVIGNF
jgi:hypothetical protein